MGKVFLYGHNVDTDVIIPARHLNSADPAHLAAHCMEDIDPSFADKVTEGDVIVAGVNFGYGSSREHAPMAIKACGVKCVIARSFSRIFYRNAFNIGLPIFENAEAANACDAGDEVEVAFDTGMIRNMTKQETYQAQPLPPFMLDMIQAGGRMAQLSKKEDAACGL